MTSVNGGKRTARHCARVSRAGGFTLVELVVVLVVIGVLAATSAPLFFSKPVFEQSGFFNETLAAVRYAQKLAIATCSPVRVNITPTGYALFRAAGAPANCNNPCTVAGTASPVVDPADLGRNFARTAPAGITLSPTTDILFCPLGNANADVTVGVGTQQFRVWGVTGFVERL